MNYQKHLDEVRDQSQLHHGNEGHTAPIHSAGLFLKASSALVGPGEGIALRKLDRRNDHEVELAVVIGREAKDVSRGDALGHVAGYAIGLDITIRGPEERSLRKSPDSYAVLGPWLVTPDEIANPGNLDLRIAVNGEERQNSNTRYLILGVAELIEYASSFYTLYPGDIIITGTPEGVSPIQPGDVISAYVERIGTMEVKGASRVDAITVSSGSDHPRARAGRRLLERPADADRDHRADHGNDGRTGGVQGVRRGRLGERRAGRRPENRRRLEDGRSERADAGGNGQPPADGMADEGSIRLGDAHPGDDGRRERRRKGGGGEGHRRHIRCRRENPPVVHRLSPAGTSTRRRERVATSGWSGAVS